MDGLYGQLCGIRLPAIFGGLYRRQTKYGYILYYQHQFAGSRFDFARWMGIEQQVFANWGDAVGRADHFVRDSGRAGYSDGRCRCELHGHANNYGVAGRWHTKLVSVWRSKTSRRIRWKYESTSHSDHADSLLGLFCWIAGRNEPCSVRRTGSGVGTCRRLPYGV